jgi:SAM-dependent methyltransferase
MSRPPRRLAPAPAENAGNGACDVMTSRQGDGISHDEVRRIRMVYSERERKLLGTVKEDKANRGNERLLHEYRDRLARVLRERFQRPLSECRVLDLGCGYGSLLGWFHEQGTPAENLVGVDLLPSRIAIARERFPAFTFVEANAEQFDFPDASFDLVPVFTVFSSILDRRMARNVAWNIRRVLAPHGAVVWYDMRYPNPWNPHLKAMTKARIKELFPSFALELETISLIPPLARRLGPFTTTAYPLFASIPALRTHYIGLLRTPRHAARREPP